MHYQPDNPLVVQGDHTLLLEVLSPRYPQARDALLGFAELVKNPEYVHTWRITKLSLWNAAAAGHTASEVIEALERFARYPVPENIPVSVRETMGRYGRLKLLRDGGRLRLEADEPVLMRELQKIGSISDLLGPLHGDRSVQVAAQRRGELKQVLLSLGFPVQDLAGYDDGPALEMRLEHAVEGGEDWQLRDYQLAAVDAFHAGPDAGSGVVVLPCGAGKTIVGMAAMVRLGMRTLILCAGHTAVQQWRQELLTRTNLRPEDVGEYSGRIKELKPVTISTYQLLTWRPDKHAGAPHFELLYRAAWGLVIYDEVHLLPAPVFRETAYLQARRRLGLTATLVREDGREGDVFALIGPKRFDLPWKELEHQGWIATARCVELRVPLSDADRLRYVDASARARTRIAALNARKGAVLEALLARHPDEQIVVLGTYLDQLRWLSRRFDLELITGETPNRERDSVFARFRAGELRVLALSKVGNFAIDLPAASVAIQVSGTFGSRQEEAQRLGRILRPKPGINQATFYSLVTADSREQEYAERRQLFLTEQGYPYRIELAG
jgi:DNA excision repair protein ERCC-3